MRIINILTNSTDIFHFFSQIVKPDQMNAPKLTLHDTVCVDIKKKYRNKIHSSRPKKTMY